MSPRLLCAEGRYDQALAELDESIYRSRESNSMGELVRLLALQAVTLNARGNRETARTILREAVELGKPAGYIRRWLDAGPGIGSLLRYLRDQSDTPWELHSYLDLLLEVCRSAFGDMTLQPVEKMLDPLTARELEIMRLIRDGCSYKEIADELVVTINTIKTHTSNIYSKLGVHSRTQAIARTRDLGLV